MPVEREIHRRNGDGLGEISAVAVPRHGWPFQQFLDSSFVSGPIFYILKLALLH